MAVAREKRSRITPRKRTTRGSEAERARRKFLRFFPDGFQDETYLDWERDYKANAHARWQEVLDRETHRALIRDGKSDQVAARAVSIESRTNLLFSFEKMALRDAVKTTAGAKAFAAGLYDFLYGTRDDPERFERWVEVVAELPRKQTRVLTWPIVTVFGFIAQPERHIFLKPNVTKLAAAAYGTTFDYKSRPNWATYKSLLDFAALVRRDVRDLRPRDMIDIQSFIWVLGSDEYEE